MDNLESIGRELRDLRGDLINVKRSMRHGRRDSQDEEAGSPLGTAFVRSALIALAHGLKRNDIAEVWKAVTNPAMLSVPGWAAELATSAVGSFILGLGGQSRAFPQIASRAHGYELSANFRPLALTASAVAAFTAEGDAIGTTEARILANTITPHSVKALTEVTEEMLERSDAETIMRQLLTDAIGTALELGFFSDDAPTTAAPAGIRFGIPASAAGQSFSEDAATLIAALGDIGDVVFVMSPGRLASLSAQISPTFAYPLLASSGVGADELIAIDCADIAVGIGGVSHKVGREATIVEANPAAPFSTPGEPPTIAAPIRSTWQTDVISLKSTLGVSWGRSQTAVAWIDAVTW